MHEATTRDARLQDHDFFVAVVTLNVKLFEPGFCANSKLSALSLSGQVQ
jgi:hypothetical protein